MAQGIHSASHWEYAPGQGLRWSPDPLGGATQIVPAPLPARAAGQSAADWVEISVDMTNFLLQPVLTKGLCGAL